MSINARGWLGKFAVSFALILLVGFCPSVASASCVRGSPTYSDIDAVRFERTNCFGGKCPTYEVVLTKEEGCYYVGMHNVDKIGTYKGACVGSTMLRTIAALRTHAFYTLHYDSEVLALDVPHYIVSVERCGVTTILDWPAYEGRKDIMGLLDNLDRVADSVRWHKISDSVQEPLEGTAVIP
jgi:hypothetical protein